ncbi:hypothetical protein D1872_317080 [compost metagenome]
MLAASSNAALISSVVTSFFSSATISVIAPSGTGTRSAIASILPLSEGITSVVAIAAPVVVGMILTAAARPRRLFRARLSTVV